MALWRAKDKPPVELVVANLENKIWLGVKMRILHYGLGFPPYRTGGMTKFCMDIMAEQRNIGHDVALLWPGQDRKSVV